MVTILYFGKDGYHYESKEKFEHVRPCKCGKD